MGKKFQEMGALIMVLTALLGVTYLAIVVQDKAAQGALMSVLSAGVGWSSRGKVETSA